MSIRTRIILSFVFLVSAGFYFLVDWILDDLRPRYLESVEEALVDNAHILAALLAMDARERTIDTGHFRQAFQEVYRHTFSARIYKLIKNRVDLRIYVTDMNGVVLFDSDHGKDEGKDYSQWRDVVLTLKGQYGARTTQAESPDSRATTLYVAAPIQVEGKTVGVLTLCKSTASINFFIQSAQPKIIVAGSVAALSVIILGIVVSTWVTRPIQRLTAYARAVRDGRRASLPRLGRSEIGEMGTAFEEMREALEGKRYAEQYVQTLTHELKSPLSAIQGAAELLQEDMPRERRALFLHNVFTEVKRVQQLVDRLLELSALENRRGLRDVEIIEFKPLLDELMTRMGPLVHKKNLSLTNRVEENLRLKGERFLIEQALINLVQNAVDFSPAGGTIIIASQKKGNRVGVTVEDQGPGVPEYARDRVFEKFYSLKRPDTGRKSTGLGLSMVKEVAALHGGEVMIENRPTGGARVTLFLPSEPAAL